MCQETSNNANNEYHMPVMLEECLDGLNIRQDGIYVDVTFGGGGHSRAILKRLGDNGHLYAFDQDNDAASNVIDDPRFTFIHENFKHLRNFLRLYGVRHIDGLLADLGVSSHQFDIAERGFSTRFDGPLDLRMDRRQQESASDLVNNATEEELTTILRLYGELPNAKAIAHSIANARSIEPITTTAQLKESVRHHLPKGHENKWLAMIFQALRIEVNGELEALKQMLQQATELLNPAGRICVISYHSLEDRIVKNYFKSGNFEGKIEQDFYGNVLAPLKAVGRKPATASETELATNNRARSAKLRIAEK